MKEIIIDYSLEALGETIPKTYTLYTDAEIDGMASDERRKISLDVGVGSWGDKFTASADALFQDKINYKHLRTTRNHLINQVIWAYTTNEQVRRWMDKMSGTTDGSVLVELRDMRSTTDYYVSEWKPVAVKALAQKEKEVMSPAWYEQMDIKHAASILLSAITLAEQF